MSDATSKAPRALVLAGRRTPGERSPGGTLRHKALEPVDGVAMLERVVAALDATGRFAVITVCSDDEALLRATPALAALADRGSLRFTPSAASPAASVAAFLSAEGAAGPVLATAADHALLRPEWVAHFLDAADATQADAVLAVVEASLFRREFPTARRTFIPLAGSAISGANLFMFRTAKGVEVARFWVRAESFRKRPWRMVAVFGPLALFRFLARRLDLDGALREASRVIGVRVGAVRMPFAECAIDVDTPEDLVLASRLLAARRAR